MRDYTRFFCSRVVYTFENVGGLIGLQQGGMRLLCNCQLSLDSLERSLKFV
jgi:hypothetical protein